MKKKGFYWDFIPENLVFGYQKPGFDEGPQVWSFSFLKGKLFMSACSTKRFFRCRGASSLWRYHWTARSSSAEDQLEGGTKRIWKFFCFGSNGFVSFFAGSFAGIKHVWALLGFQKSRHHELGFFFLCSKKVAKVALHSASATSENNPKVFFWLILWVALEFLAKNQLAGFSKRSKVALNRYWVGLSLWWNHPPGPSVGQAESFVAHRRVASLTKELRKLEEAWRLSGRGSVCLDVSRVIFLGLFGFVSKGFLMYLEL